MKFICIGRNYADHAKELNNPIPEEPVFFLKPETALLRKNEPFYYPDFSNDIHYEVELVLCINKLGKNIPEKFAHTYYDEIGIGIDFTARDIQNRCKEKGLPWEKAKAFDSSAPVSRLLPKESLMPINNILFHLDINGKTVQQGRSEMMINSFDKIIAEASKYFMVKKGDYIFTGTPAGVGAVKIGDRLEAYIGNEKLLDFYIK